jgi:uncharacterized HhH-GPD family protein
MTTQHTLQRPTKLAWTEHPEAQQLIAQNPVAFVIGFILDQQVRVQTAFAAPLHLLGRLGHLDPARIAAMPVEELEAAFHQPFPLHRYHRAMARRVHACMSWLVEAHGGEPELVWRDATDMTDLRSRIAALPGFGKLKAATVSMVLARKFGMNMPGWDDNMPPYGSLALVDSLDDLAMYQRRKSAYKRALRGGASPSEAAAAVAAATARR